MKRTTKILIFASLLLLTALLSGFLTLHFFGMPATRVQTDLVTGKMEEVGRLLEAYFIEEYDPSVLEAAAADGAAAAMIEATGDRWSCYIPAADMQEYEEQMANAYVGVGITILMVEDGAQIVEVTADGPAQSAGLQVGDVLTSVDGTQIGGMDLDSVVALVSGPEGTKVQFTVQRGDQLLETDVTRAEILLPVAFADMLENEIGLIRISNFDAHCAEETLAYVEELVSSGAKALIFDVRFNGGGYKDELVEILDALLPEGVLFRSVDYAGREEIINSDEACLDIPMAVLVNEESYSAAEFFAAALQEYEAALIVGMQTTGKGNFQYTLGLSDGSAVALSTGRYFTPKGVSLTEIGITPDISVDLSDEDFYACYHNTLKYADDEQLQEAMKALLAKSS